MIYVSPNILYSLTDDSCRNRFQIIDPGKPKSVILFSTNCLAVFRGSSKVGFNIVVSRLQSKMCLQMTNKIINYSYENKAYTYIINPPNIAHNNWMKFDEKPFFKNEWLVVWFSVSDTLENKMKSTKHKIFQTPEWYQSNFFSNSIQT